MRTMLWRIPLALNQDGGGGGNGGGTGGGAGGGNPGGGNGGGTGGGAGGDAGGGGKTVDYAVFQRVVEAKNGLEGQVRQLQGQVQTLSEKAATVDTLAGQVNEWKTKFTEAEGRFTTFSEFSGALGTTDADVIGVFDQKYKALPEANRPSRADWIGTLRSKPDEAPALLRPWLNAGGTGAASPAGGKSEDKPKPKVPGAGGTPPGTAGQVTADQIRAAREKGQKTGDWSAFKELKKRMAGAA